MCGFVCVCVCVGEELYEELSCGLLEKKDQMMSKYQHLLLHDSMVSGCTLSFTLHHLTIHPALISIMYTAIKNHTVMKL